MKDKERQDFIQIYFDLPKLAQLLSEHNFGTTQISRVFACLPHAVKAPEFRVTAPQETRTYRISAPVHLNEEETLAYVMNAMKTLLSKNQLLSKTII